MRRQWPGGLMSVAHGVQIRCSDVTTPPPSHSFLTRLQTAPPRLAEVGASLPRPWLLAGCRRSFSPESDLAFCDGVCSPFYITGYITSTFPKRTHASNSPRLTVPQKALRNAAHDLANLPACMQHRHSSQRFLFASIRI